MNNDIKKLDDQLTEGERVRVIRLIEECSEVTQEATKLLRFGALNHHPADNTKERNVYRLERECGDLLRRVQDIYPTLLNTIMKEAR